MHFHLRRPSPRKRTVHEISPTGALWTGDDAAEPCILFRLCAFSSQSRFALALGGQRLHTVPVAAGSSGLSGNGCAEFSSDRREGAAGQTSASGTIHRVVLGANRTGRGSLSTCRWVNVQPGGPLYTLRRVQGGLCLQPVGGNAVRRFFRGAPADAVAHRPVLTRGGRQSRLSPRKAPALDPAQLKPHTARWTLCPCILCARCPHALLQRRMGLPEHTS